MCLQQAASQQVDLIVFPELVISSYPPLDLLDLPWFWQSNQEALERLLLQAAQLSHPPQLIVLGSLQQLAPAKAQKPIQNTAMVFEYQVKLKAYQLKLIQPKRLLPTYDVFDEVRYFEPGTQSKILNFQGLKIGITVCEDIWFDSTKYPTDPADDLKNLDFILNLSASPFELNKIEKRQQNLKNFIKKTQAPVVYVNQIGANDEILFDGSSAVYDRQAKVVLQLPAFNEGLAVFTYQKSSDHCGSNAQYFSLQQNKNNQALGWHSNHSALNQPNHSAIAIIYQGLVLGIRDYFNKTGFKKAVIGLSGGIDSAVTACLAVAALGAENVIGIAMPSQYSSGHSISDAEELAQKLKINFSVNSIKFLFSTFMLELKNLFQNAAADITEENLQARLRGVLLMAVANKKRGLVLTTGNKSELAVGYCTTYGDMAGALAPLGDLYKTRVYELARYINTSTDAPPIPQSTLEKPPSAELRPNQKDQDSLPDYAVLDQLLEGFFEQKKGSADLIAAGFSADLVQKILNLIKISEFKRRQAAPVLKVTSKAFGLGRRVPIVRQ